MGKSESHLTGILYMLLTGVLFVGVIGIVKIMDGGLPAAESAFLRYLLGLAFLVPMLRPIWQARLGRDDLLLFGLRGAVHALGVVLWFYAMASIPMAEVTSMGYLSPVYVTLGAALFLGERLAIRRILAIGAALIGVLIILRPGFRAVSTGHMAMVLASGLFGASYLIAKLMTGRVRAVVVVGMLSVFVTIALAPLAAMVWVQPTLSQLGWIFLVASFATAGHYTMTLAFQAAPITVTQPVTFLQLVWSVALGAVFFAEPVDGWVILGGGVILGAVSFIAWRETRRARAEITPRAPAPETGP